MIVDLSLGSSAARAVLAWNDSTSVSGGAGGDGQIGPETLSFLHHGIGAWRKSRDVLRAGEWTQSLDTKARSRHQSRQARVYVRARPLVVNLPIKIGKQTSRPGRATNPDTIGGMPVLPQLIPREARAIPISNEDL